MLRIDRICALKSNVNLSGLPKINAYKNIRSNVKKRVDWSNKL